MERSQKIKTLSLNTVLFAIGNFGTKFISFFLVPLYTYVLSTQEYGNLDLITTTVQLLAPILTLNFQDAILRFALDKTQKPEEVMNVGLKVFGAGSLIMLGGVLLVTRLGVFPLDTAYFWYLFALFITTSLYNMFSMYLRAVNRIRLFVICGIVNTLITCCLNLLFLLVWKLGVVGYMMANIAGALAAVVLMFAFGGIAKTIPVKGSAALFKSMALYSVPLLVGSIAWWINNTSDRYILTFFCGAMVDGIYAVSYKIPTILSTVQGVFYNSWSISAITEFDKDDQDGFIGNVYAMYSCVSFIGCSAIMLGNLWIARVLYANEFFQAWQSVPFLLLGTVYSGIGLFEGCLFTAVKKTKAVSATTLAGAAVNTVLNFALIPVIGPVGAAIATFLGYFATWIVRTVQMRKFVSIRINWVNQALCMLLLLGQCVVATIWGRFYFQIGFAILIVALQWKQIKKVLDAVTAKFRRA